MQGNKDTRRSQPTGPGHTSELSVVFQAITGHRRQSFHCDSKVAAGMTLNRKRAAMARLDAPLGGDEMPIRIGNHHALPTIMQNIPDVEPTGFSGAISTLKILRQ